MRLVTAQEMREMDRKAIEELGIPQMSLMENAGKAVADVALNMGMKRWLILAGKGNNGGDGLVAARHLLESGCEVTVVYACDPDSLQGAALQQKRIIDNIGIPFLIYPEQSVPWTEYEGIIDALLGTGTTGSPREPAASLIREANNSERPIVAVDIPSGIDTDTGQVFEPCIRASATVALGMVKPGMVMYPAAEYCGDIRLQRIGIPEWLADDFANRCRYVTSEEIRQIAADWFAGRYADTHKGTYGHVLVAAGSKTYSGAGMLATRAALRSGAGLVSWLVPGSIAYAMSGHVPEAMLIRADDRGKGSWEHCKPESIVDLTRTREALVIGPGIDRFRGDEKWIARVLNRLTCPTVVDADALNMIADTGQAEDIWRQAGPDVVITPHPGEMARLCGKSTAEVQQNRIGTAVDYARENGITVVLKGARTVIATAEGDTFINSTGNPAMASGGTGDVLAGLIGGLLAQGFVGWKAAVLGVYMHGEAGDRAAAGRNRADSMLAGDIIEAL